MQGIPNQGILNTKDQNHMWDYILKHSPLLYMTQSLWRDEAFSVLAAEKSLSFIYSKLGFEPPVYYSILHFWIQLFGSSDLSARILSLIGFLLACWVIIEWGAILFKKHWLSLFLPVFFFLNPMLLYYAFEVRTYAWYTFFAVSTLYTYSTKRWRLFIPAAILGFYTHVYLLPFLAALGLHWVITTKPWKRHMTKTVVSDAAFQSFAVISVAITPWLIRMTNIAQKLNESWYFPVDRQLVYSVLGNMFVGYEGTPWFGWRYTKYLSLIIIGFTALSLTDKKNRGRNVLFALFGFLPLALIVAVSFVKPLFVNRYLIPATVAEVLIITAALAAIRNKALQKIAAAILLIFVLWVNWWIPQYHQKAPIRETLSQVSTLLKNNDVILAGDALIYLETLYYANDRSRVYLHNPDNAPFPWYIGDALITDDRMIADYPIYPTRAFLIHRNGTFDIVYRVPVGFAGNAL